MIEPKRGLNLRLGCLFFLGVFLTYASLTPGSIIVMGYMGEEMQSGDSILALLDAPSHRNTAPVKWSRNGPLSITLNLPFQMIGKHFVSEDFVLSFSPILETALLITILFLWLLEVTSGGRHSSSL